jgi:hypothetical protein
VDDVIEPALHLPPGELVLDEHSEPIALWNVQAGHMLCVRGRWGYATRTVYHTLGLLLVGWHDKERSLGVEP